MTDTDQRAFAETVFERNQRRDAEINEALKQEKRAPRGSRQEHVPPEGIASRNAIKRPKASKPASIRIRVTVGSAAAWPQPPRAQLVDVAYPRPV